MKKSDLYREWARVLDMCEGTNVDPGLCWMCNGRGRNFSDTPAFTDAPEDYSFAVAILEDKPVFVGDKVWGKNIEDWIVVFDGMRSLGECCWQPPKETFTLNGEELPCPELDPNYNFCVKLDICGGDEHSFTCKFRSLDERNKVAGAIIKLLKDATK